MGFRGGNFIFDAGEHAEFAFHRHIAGMSVFDNFLRERDVFIVGKSGTVDHDGGETEVDTGFAELKAVAMVKMQNDRNRALAVADLSGVFHRALRHVAEKGLVGVVAGAFGDLKDHRRLIFSASLNDCLKLFHVVEVESGDRVMTRHRLFEHLARIHETEIFVAYCHFKILSLKVKNLSSYFIRQTENFNHRNIKLSQFVKRCWMQGIPHPAHPALNTHGCSYRNTISRKPHGGISSRQSDFSV